MSEKQSDIEKALQHSHLFPESGPSQETIDKQTLVEEVSMELFGTTPDKAKRQEVCVMCKKSVGKFKDQRSQREYEISSLCQVCQDLIFS